MRKTNLLSLQVRWLLMNVGSLSKKSVFQSNIRQIILEIKLFAELDWILCIYYNCLVYFLTGAGVPWLVIFRELELKLLFLFPLALFSLFVTFMLSKLLLTFPDDHRGRARPILPDKATTIATTKDGYGFLIRTLVFQILHK